MNRLVIAVVLCTALMGAALAGATPTVPSFRTVLRAASATDVAPAEWSGIWTLVDSMYDCAGSLLLVSTGQDTICAGQQLTESSSDPNMQMTCDASVTLNTYHMTCTGTELVIPDCMANFSLEANGTFSGDSYYSVMTMTTSYSGTAEGCSTMPSSCTQINMHGTRTGTAPEAYCASVPARAATWGKLKAIYR